MVVVSLEREPILAFCCVSPQQRARFTDTSSLFFFFLNIRDLLTPITHSFWKKLMF